MSTDDFQKNFQKELWKHFKKIIPEIFEKVWKKHYPGQPITPEGITTATTKFVGKMATDPKDFELGTQPLSRILELEKKRSQEQEEREDFNPLDDWGKDKS